MQNLTNKDEKEQENYPPANDLSNDLQNFLEKIKLFEKKNQRSVAFDLNRIDVGDIVKAKPPGSSLYFEGVVVDIDGDNISVDYGDAVESVRRKDCYVVLSGFELEVGDIVEIKPSGMSLYFRGTILHFNENGTVDVKMDGDDADDIERNVSTENIRKVMTHRQLAVFRWKKSVMTIEAANAFTFSGKQHRQKMSPLSTIIRSKLSHNSDMKLELEDPDRIES